MILKTDWSEVKRLSTEKNIPMQWLESRGQTYVLVVDGSFTAHAILDFATEELAEFEASYKSTTSRRVATSTSALSNPEDYRFRGTATAWTECPAGQTTNIDITPSASEDRWVSGGIIVHKDVNPGDTVSFKVVHPLAGVVETYVPSWLLPPGSGSQKIEVYPARIPSGIILRVSYTNTGASSSYCGINYFLHRRGTGS